MKNQFLPIEQAFILQEIGFNDLCIMCYRDVEPRILRLTPYTDDSKYKTQTFHKPDFYIPAPTYQQAFKFFRDEFKLEGHIKSWEREGEIVYYYSVNKLGKPSKFNDVDFRGKTYEEAELACIKRLIETVSK